MGGGIDGSGARAARSAAARRSGLNRAKRTRCSACGRQNATKRHQLDPWTAIRKCRYCGDEKPVMMDGHGTVGVDPASLQRSRLSFSTQVVDARRGRGEDRIAMVRRAGHTRFLIADGAGGVAGGRAAADALCLALVEQAEGVGITEEWVEWLTRHDRAMAASGASGLAAAIVLSVSDDGAVSGASVGDCEAWVFGQGAFPVVGFTEHQRRKPLLGSGEAIATGFATFATPLARGQTLVVASDGLWKYMKPARIAANARLRPIEEAAAALVSDVRLPSGALQDDIAVLLCEVTTGPSEASFDFTI